MTASSARPGSPAQSGESMVIREWPAIAPTGGRRSPFAVHRDTLQAWVEIPSMCALLHLPKGGRVLEVGCGRGNALPSIARLCAPSHLTGIDLDPGFLHEAACRVVQNQIPLSLLQGDVRALPFPDASFDLVIDFGTCYHITEPERAIREVARVLVPNGLFVSESRLAQLLAHPRQFRGWALPWHVAPELVPVRHAGLWALRWKEVEK